MKTTLLVTALLLSSISLALQLKKAENPIFQKFLAPTTVSYYDWNALAANVGFIRESRPLIDGMGIPVVMELSEDHSSINVRVIVDEGTLPKNYDDRKSKFKSVGDEIVLSIGVDFGLSLEESETATRVEFISLKSMGKSSEPYAVYEKGKLTFH
jgi:hypothetical protein